jgi:putative endonuclease
MFYTYVLKSKNDDLYIGQTSDLRRRIKEHNQGLNLSTKRYRPWSIIYYECCLHSDDAKRREKYFKTSQGRRLLRRRLKEYFYSRKMKDLTN